MSIRDYDDHTITLGGVYSTETSSYLEAPFTVESGKSGFQIFLYSNYTGTALATNCLFEDLSVELGSVAGEYEEYNAETYTPAADGTVEIPSISPCMTLLTDTAGVNITLDYKQDSNAFKANTAANIQELGRVTAELANNIGDIETALDEKNNIQMWQPNTDYKVGDVVIGDISFDGFYYFHAILTCYKNHISQSEIQEDMRLNLYEDVRSGMWVVKPFISRQAETDSEGNYFPNHYATKEEVDAKIGSFNNTFANIINANIADTSIVVNDVSPIEHSIGCRLSSKNLFDKSKIQGIDTDKYGTTGDWGYNIKLDTDGDDILVTSSTGTFFQVMFRGLELELGQTYTISIAEEPTHESTWGWFIAYMDGTFYSNNSGNYKTSLTFTPNKEIKYIAFRIGWGSETITSPIRLTKPQLELGTTATTYMPPIADVSNIKVVQYKRNLFNPYAYSSLDNATIEDDGSISLGTTEGEVNSSSFNYEISLKKGTYNFKFEKQLTDASYPFYFEVTHNDTSYFPSNLDSFSFRFSANDGDVLKLDGWCPAPIFDVGNIKIQLEFDTATDYERPTVYTSLADGTVEGIKSISPNMTLLTNKGVLIHCNYNIDTKAYIDNKFAELQALILEG